MSTANDALAVALNRRDPRAAHHASRTFSDIIIRASGNRELRRMLSASFSWLERLVLLCFAHNLAFSQNIADFGLEINQKILAAIERDDLSSALELCRCGLDRLQRAVEALPDDIWSDS